MNILNFNNTPDDPKQLVMKMINLNVSTTFEQIKNSQRLIFKQVWEHDVLSPQEVLDSLGTDATSLLSIGSDSVSLILKYEPDFPSCFWKPPFVLRPNADGTVTVTDIPNN